MSMEPVFAAFFAVLLGGESLDAADARRRRCWCWPRCSSSSSPRAAGSRPRCSTSRSDPSRAHRRGSRDPIRGAWRQRGVLDVPGANETPRPRGKSAATRSRKRSDQAGEHRGGLLGVVAGDVEVGDQADGGRARRRRPARRASRAAATKSAASRRGRRPRCWCRRSPGRRRSASASSRAWAWSSASRSTWWSSACRPAAARMPTWRIPPPIRLRQTRASAIGVGASRPSASRPARRAPWTGRPPARRRSRRTPRAATPVATWAFQIRAPSRWTRDADAGRRTSRSVAQVREREHRSAGEVVGVLDRDRRGAARRTAPCRGRTSTRIAGRSTWPRGCVQVRIVSPVSAPWAPSSARAMWARDSHSTSWPGRDQRARRRARWPSSRSA